MPSIPSSLRKLFMFAALPVLTFLLGWQAGLVAEDRNFDEEWIEMQDVTVGSGRVIGDPEKEADISLVWNVWRLLQRHYIDPSELKSRSLVQGAAEGLVRAVGDPYTVFMTPKENTEFRRGLEGKLQGIGAELSKKDDFVVIVAPLKGSPAERAGLLPGDIIAKVDDESIEGLTLDQVVSKIRGQRGTVVTIMLYREGTEEPLTKRITREDIRVPTVESKILTTSGGTLGYVSLAQFGQNSMPEVREVLQSFKGKPIKGIILDLRYNGGGYLDGAVELSSMFLKKGEVVTVESRETGKERHSVTGRPLYPDIPLVVLINQASASASEIVAGALQDHSRAKVIGMKSFGKGTVQEVIDLPDGGSLRVTIARWFTPKGKNLGKEGVQPDIQIEQVTTASGEKKDTQLDAATAWLIEGKDISKEAKVSSSGKKTNQ